MNYIFISKPRCASTSICNAILSKKDRHKDIHITAEEYIRRYGKKKWNDSYTFAIVRHPIDLICSWYYHHKVKYPQLYPDNIEDWIVNNNFKTHWNWQPLHQYKWVCDSKDNILVNDIYNYESINSDWNIIKNKIKLNVDLSCENGSINHNTNIRLTNVALEKIHKIFEKDFIMFNYK